MAIIISKDGRDAKKVEKSEIEKEDFLQKYIHDNPESIPLYDYKEGIRLLTLAREFSTNAGKIDVLGIDADGEIYLIETKRYKNPDKRLVVAQMLDYGAAIWRNSDPEDFLRRLDDCARESLDKDLKETIRDFFELDDEGYGVVQDNLRANIRDGSFRFVVLMDKLHEGLKDLVLFINENSRFDIFAVEVEYYEHDGYEILIPKLFGTEIKKDSGGGRAGKWDNERFFLTAIEEVGEGALLERMRQVYEFTMESGRLGWGSGSAKGSFTFKFEHPDSKSGWVSLFTVNTLGMIRFRFGNVKARLGREATERYFDVLHRLPVARSWQKSKTIEEKPQSGLLEAIPDGATLELFKQAILAFLGEAQTARKNS